MKERAKMGNRQHLSVAYWQSPIGIIALEADTDVLVSLQFVSGTEGRHRDIVTSHPVLKQTISQLHRYFKGDLKTFDLPLSVSGTSFQSDVWHALGTIPYGEIRCYKDIATLVGRPKSYRAVGMANSKNPIAIVIPCHRVVGADGDLIGYSGGIERKKFLLELEK